MSSGAGSPKVRGGRPSRAYGQRPPGLRDCFVRLALIPAARTHSFFFLLAARSLRHQLQDRPSAAEPPGFSMGAWPGPARGFRARGGAGLRLASCGLGRAGGGWLKLMILAGGARAAGPRVGWARRGQAGWRGWRGRGGRRRRLAVLRPGARPKIRARGAGRRSRSENLLATLFCFLPHTHSPPSPHHLSSTLHNGKVILHQA